MNRTEFVAQQLPNMLEDLGRLVAVNTVFDPATAADGAPFGKGPAEGLRLFLDMAAHMGMETVNYDGYAGDITLGKGPAMVGILGHMDVVDVGPGWETPPFQMVVRDGKAFGRGTSDDKGPLVSCLYAMKYLAENGLLPEGTSVRMIVGCDEEEGLQCIEYYKQHAPRMPDCSFVPDGYFPLVNCEKGLIDFDLVYSLTADPAAPVQVRSLSGGSGRNVVPNSAACTLAFDSAHRAEVLARLNDQPGLAVEGTMDGCVVKTTGVSTHAMSPEKGDNAISKLLHGLKSSGVRFSCQDFLDAYDRLIGLSYHGEPMDCHFRDELSGELTLNIGTMELKDGRITLCSNVRYPVSYSKEDLMGRMMKQLEDAGFRYVECLEMPSLYIDRKDPLIQKLMEAYQEISGDTEHEAFSIGGATYARCLPNAVSFGPLFPYETELAHEDNECISVESLKKMTEIYILALEKLLEDT